MINPAKQKYMYTNPLGESIYIEENNNIYKRINTLIENNTILQIKGHGSKVNNINWKLFFGVDTKVNTNLNLPDKINVANFNKFNYTVSEWFRNNLINIESNKVVIQYDGDKLLEDNYKNSDTLLQNYTGVIIGLIYYLLSLGKEVHILCILDKPENKWNKNIDYYWENGFNQMSRLGVDIHFWIYDLISANKEELEKIRIVKPNNIKTEIWGYKGFWNMNYLHSLNYKESMILNFGVGDVVKYEFTYLKYLKPKIFNKIKDKIYLYNFTRIFDKQNNAVCYKTIANIEFIKELISS